MSEWLTRLRRMSGLFVAAALSTCFFFCRPTDQDAPVFLEVAKDSSWNAFDSLEIVWKDSVHGIEGILFRGQPKTLDSVNSFSADKYAGGIIQLYYRGYQSGTLVSEIVQTFDSQSPTVVKRDTLLGPIAVKNPPRPFSLPIQTISINDTVTFSIKAGMDSGVLKAYAFDLDGNGTTDDSAALSGISAVIQGSAVYRSIKSYSPSLKVYSAAGGMTEATGEITVVQDLPSANAGPDLTVYIGDTVQLVGIGQDKLGKVTHMEWKVGDSAYTQPTSIDDSSATLSFLAPNQSGEVTAYFKVTDDDTQSVVDTTIIQVIDQPANSSADLLSLTFSKGTPTPRFSSADTTYTMTLANSIASLTVTPTVAETTSTVKVNGEDVSSGHPTASLPLALGYNSISIQVTAENGKAKTYRVNILRSVITLVASGGSHSLFLKSDGSVWATGLNTDGQLGDGTTVSKQKPVQIMKGESFSQIAAGETHSLFLKTDGTLWATGANKYGELGDGTTTLKKTPVQIMKGTTFSQIKAGFNHSFFIATDGKLYATGNNSEGQLGDGTTTLKNAPVRIMTGWLFSEISCGGFHSIFMKTDSTLWATGSNTYGQLGDGTSVSKSTPVQIMAGVKISQIAAGLNHSLFMQTNGKLWAAGQNAFGQLGDGSTTNQWTPVPIMASLFFWQISAGYTHSVFVQNGGNLWATGSNNHGQLGDGTLIDRTTPVQINAGTRYYFIAGGQYHSLFQDNAGVNWAAGINTEGQLGDGTTTERRQPVKVAF